MHCNEDHKTGDKSCRFEEREREICDIQHKEKVSWPAAREIFDERQPLTESYLTVATRPRTSDNAPKKRIRQGDSDGEGATTLKQSKLCRSEISTDTSDSEISDNCTSENHPRLREEAEMEFYDY